MSPIKVLYLAEHTHEYLTQKLMFLASMLSLHLYILETSMPFSALLTILGFTNSSASVYP